MQYQSLFTKGTITYHSDRELGGPALHFSLKKKGVIAMHHSCLMQKQRVLKDLWWQRLQSSFGFSKSCIELSAYVKFREERGNDLRSSVVRSVFLFDQVCLRWSWKM